MINQRHNVSPTLAIHQAMQARIAQGLPCYRFGFGQSPFPVPSVMVAALQEAAHEKAYLPSQGLKELREKVAAYYDDRYQLDNHADQVIIGPGSKELLFLTQLLFKRDLILPAPSWVSYAPQAKYLDFSTHWVPCSMRHDFKMQAEDLEAALSKLSRPALLILNAPNNPAGHVYSQSEINALASVARKHQLLVIADEIYSEYSFEPFYSFAQAYPENTILCSGLSKSRGAGGWRLGWMVFPKQLIGKCKKLVALASETFSCVSSPIQYAALEAFDAPEIKEYVHKTKYILHCVSQFVQNNLNGKIKSVPSAGGFYTMVQFDSKQPDDAEICRQLMEKTGVALLAGQHFGNAPEAKTARLAFVDFDGKAILEDPNLEGLDNNLANPHFDQLKEGIRLLNVWANAQ